MKKRMFSMLILCLIGLQSVFAQNREVSGVVTSADDGLSVPGVSVIVKGTSIGTSTGIDGKYSISVPADGKTLVFSFVGMKPVEMPISSNMINVIMESESIGMDEVMVVAYGTAKKSSFSGSAVEVKGEKLERKKTTEITQALEGEIAGVQIFNESGQPGMTSKIRIRGIGSLNASEEPLIVLDGIPFGGDLSSIDTRDIASFTVLKDASAAALYGSRAANGVVMIVTKKGIKGKSKISVNADYGLNLQINPFYDTTNGVAEYYQYSWEALKNTYMYGNEGLGEAAAIAKATEQLVPSLGGYNLYDINGDGKIDATDNAIIGADGKLVGSANRLINDDWRDELIRAGKRKSIGVNISGGSDKTTYYSSFNFLDDEGYVDGSDFKRFSSTINLDHRVNDWLKVTQKITYSHFKMHNAVSEETTAGNNAFHFANNVPPIYPVFVYDEFGNKVLDSNGDIMYDYADNNPALNGKKRRFAQAVNPARSYDLDEEYTVRNEVVGNMGLDVNLTENLKFTTNFGMNYAYDLAESQQNSMYGDSKGKGFISKTQNSYLNYTWNQLLTYNKQIEDHSFNVLLGHEAYSYERKYIYGSKTKTLQEHTPEFANAVVIGSLDSDTYERSIESYFGQVVYDYQSKYFLKGSVRADGSSRFPNDAWGTFWSVAGSWKMSEEDFLKQADFIDHMKFKMSYGVQGNEAVDSSYPSYDYDDIVNVDGEIGLKFANKGNPNLTWESNYNFNTGLEFSMFNKKISAELEFYIRDTKDMLYSRPVANSLGYDEIYVNDLDMRNTGFEFNISYTPIRNEDTELTVFVNGHTYKNEITKMPLDPTTGEQSKFIRYGQFGYKKGGSIKERYVRQYAGVDPATGSPLWKKATGVNSLGDRVDLVDVNAGENYKDIQWETTDDYNEATRTFVGNSPIPDLNGGMGIYASHKGFDLDIKFMYQIGGKSFDGVYAGLMNSAAALGTQVYHSDISGRWQKPGDITDIPKLSAELDKNVDGDSDRWLTDASYLSLSNVRLGYNFSKNICDKISVDALNVYVSGTNLYTFSKRKGFYPQTSTTGSSSGYRYMPLSTFTFGLQLTF